MSEREQNPRGSTLVEVLAALGLLGAMFAALAPLSVTISTAAARAGGRLSWESAALAAANRILDDMATGDFSGTADQPRTVFRNGELTVLTRADASQEPAGTVENLYRRDSSNRLVRRAVRRADGRTSERELLGDVAALICELDARCSRITITIVSTHELRVERSGRLP